MFRKSAIAAAVALSTAILGYGFAASAAVPSLGGPLPIVAKPSASNIEPVQYRKAMKRKWVYNSRRHGQRYKYRHGRYRHFQGGYWYARPWWGYGGPTIALGIGPSYGAYGYGTGGSHVDWCLNRYRSYDPRSDSFMGYDGLRHRCNSPY